MGQIKLGQQIIQVSDDDPVAMLSESFSVLHHCNCCQSAKLFMKEHHDPSLKMLASTQVPSADTVATTVFNTKMLLPTR